MSEDMQQRFDSPADQPARDPRIEAHYRETEHYRKWDRLEQYQAFKFKKSVAETKVVFDCLAMVAFSATIFGFAVVGQLSEPMNDLCERPLSLTFGVLGALGLITGLMALLPIRHLATMLVAAYQKSHLAPFHRRVVGQPRSGMMAVGVGFLIAYGAAMALAYTLAHQLVLRAPPSAACVGPVT